jgi:hypothetical protein
MNLFRTLMSEWTKKISYEIKYAEELLKEYDIEDEKAQAELEEIRYHFNLFINRIKKL